MQTQESANPKAPKRAKKKSRNAVLDERLASKIANSPKLPSNRPVDFLPAPDDLTGQSFLESYAWRRLRLIALKYYGTKCMCCGASPNSGSQVNVDHIKPRKTFPELALDLGNLQILCHECNHGKGNWDMTDWRPKKHKLGYVTQ